MDVCVAAGNEAGIEVAAARLGFRMEGAVAEALSWTRESGPINVVGV